MFQDFDVLKSELQARYGSLFKAAKKLNMKYDRLISTIRGRSQMTDLEKEVFCKAVDKTPAYLGIKTSADKGLKEAGNDSSSI